MSGNLWERPVSVGHPTGRLFTGLAGDGQLDGSGNANVAGWPGTDANGAGFRGGSCLSSRTFVRASDRSSAAYLDSGRLNSRGGRGVRPAPSGVGP